MTARWRLACLALAAAGCTHAQSQRARQIGKVAAIGGIVGLVASVGASGLTDGTEPFVSGFSIVSAAGIVGYAIAVLGDPVVNAPPETMEQRNRRWARILTERASGAAREGKCARVRRLEVRVRIYDPEVHDFVFMRDAEIVRCLQAPPE
jgi:hypothetical protein